MDRVYAKSPSEVAAIYREFLEDVVGGKLRPMSFGIPQVDEVVKHVYPGRLLSIIARPSMMKTTFLTHLARVECKRLMEEGVSDRYVLFVSLEEAEGQVLCWVAGELPSPESAKAEEIGPALARAAQWPCWIVGRDKVPSLEELTPSSMPELTAEQVVREINAMAKRTGRRPSLILVDYLQILDLEGRFEQRNLMVSAALQRLKKTAQHVGCPVVVAAQAKEEVDNLPVPIPRASHAYYSAEVFHVSDAEMSLYYPWRNERVRMKGTVELPSGSYQVTKNLLWLQLLKQRHGEGTWGWPIWVDPARREIRGIYATH